MAIAKIKKRLLTFKLAQQPVKKNIKKNKEKSQRAACEQEVESLLLMNYCQL